MLVVIASVDDYGERIAPQAVEPVGQLCAADLAGECDHATHWPILRDGDTPRRF
jgi:hypothetical protein